MLELLGANLEGGGSALDFEINLGVAVVGDGDAEEGLGVDDAGDGFVGDEAGEGAVAEEGFGDELVVVAAVFEVEADDDFEVVIVEFAQGEMVGGHLEDGLGELVGVVGLGRIVLAEAEGIFVEAQPAFGVVFGFFLFEEEGPILAAAELAEGGVLSFDAVKEVEQGFALECEFELEEETGGDVEVIALCAEGEGHLELLPKGERLTRLRGGSTQSNEPHYQGE